MELITVKKLEAAKRQINSAIKLWFEDGDQVSTHSLACAAHQIIHDINKEENQSDLLYDSLLIKDEYRKEYIREMKRAMNFFKHANKDPDPMGIIEYSPRITELFILFTVVGIKRLGSNLSEIMTAFTLYYAMINPKLVKKEFRNLFNANDIDTLEIVSKREFLAIFNQIRGAS